ncbi:one-helix protein 2 [Artemisia annua]|uniref:One-helix protein 2 n=1 Tax=Artemisia annua TaxID=35608 RepID=A0A2U1LBR0_ARTAN|nr:one-helix protein 2 [Artemisia annua]
MAAAAVIGEKSEVTMEYQRQRAKEMQQYFKKKKSEESSQGPFFGFLPKNEISNGRPSVLPLQFRVVYLRCRSYDGCGSGDWGGRAVRLTMEYPEYKGAKRDATVF